MAKLKPKWVKTDIARETKIKLWRVMKNCPTYDSWEKYITRHKELFDESEYNCVRMSRDTHKALKGEIMDMPVGEVATLPLELQGWILELRPGIEEDLEEYLTAMPPELLLQLGFIPTTYVQPVVTEESITVEIKDSDGSTIFKGQKPKMLYPIEEGNCKKLVGFKEFLKWYCTSRGYDEPPRKVSP
jgi:hypothetical protein